MRCNKNAHQDMDSDRWTEIESAISDPDYGDPENWPEWVDRSTWTCYRPLPDNDSELFLEDPPANLVSPEDFA